MATKFKLTRPELKRFRDVLARYTRFLPLLKLKQQQLQIAMRQVNRARQDSLLALNQARDKMDSYKIILNDIAGVNLRNVATPEKINTSSSNIAGVKIPVLDEVIFPQARYSLFATPAWVDQALIDSREISCRQVEFDIVERQYHLLQKELAKINQRVNLFEKVKIPEAREIIRLIRIKLGDEMTAAVGRAKIAKSKIAETDSSSSGEIHAVTCQGRNA
jgi:V/A-type H+/Na+-transporting ATPase subunit D